MLVIRRGQRLSGYQKGGRTCSLSFRFEERWLLKERWLIRASTASKFSVYYKNIYMSKGSSKQYDHLIHTSSKIVDVLVGVLTKPMVRFCVDCTWFS